MNNKTKVTIICPIHGEFQQTPDSHISQKAGCPKCGRIKAKIKQLSTVEEFINKAEKIHKGKYDYSKVNYQGATIPVEIVCSKHGSFW